MATIVNTPATGEDSGSNLLVAVILIIVIFGGAVLFFIYGLPMIQNNTNQNPGTTNINVTVPPTTAPTTQTPAK